jgi:hypothetical protein
MELHHRAHDRCYIANSVRTEISVISPGGVSDTPSVLEQL